MLFSLENTRLLSFKIHVSKQVLTLILKHLVIKQVKPGQTLNLQQSLADRIRKKDFQTHHLCCYVRAGTITSAVLRSHVITTSFKVCVLCFHLPSRRNSNLKTKRSNQRSARRSAGRSGSTINYSGSWCTPRTDGKSRSFFYHVSKTFHLNL